jgi:hypothetical protein
MRVITAYLTVFTYAILLLSVSVWGLHMNMLKMPTMQKTARRAGIAGGSLLIAASLTLSPYSMINSNTVLAADTSNPTIWKSGKTPANLKTKDSKEGTKKDSKFLRAMSDCKSKCQLPGGGLAKSDCVQDCQDQVCFSYEQCSFKVKQTAGNEI